MRALLLVFAGKVVECQERLEAQTIGNALYGLRGMNSDHAEVQLVFASLKDKLTHCLDKNISEHTDFDVQDLLRTFVLFRHHIVTILVSEVLYSEYYRKFDDELIARRQRGNFFVTPEFQHKSEKVVYNRVAALKDELKITDLQHNLCLLNCFESDISFTVYDFTGAAVVVNVEVDGIFYEKKQKKIFCQLRDKELTSRGYHVVRITTGIASEIDAILRKTVDFACNKHKRGAQNS